MIQVLLSTYNGAKYLRPLLDSLLAQDAADLTILARDDGSSDDTATLLGDYAARHSGIEVVYGENVGFAESFLRLLELSSPDAKYIAFCDQDDVWQPDKMTRAIDILSRCGQDLPALYGSRVVVVDEDLRVLGRSRILKKPLSFRNALVEGPIRGCTMVMNQAARRVLLGGIPKNIHAHDCWVYVVISAFGAVCFDDQSRILYRQHPSTVTGFRLEWTRNLGLKIRRFCRIGARQVLVRQAEEFQRLYGSCLSEEYRSTVERFLAGSRKSFWGRLRYACTSEVYRQSAFDHLVLKALISLKRL